MPDYRLKRSIVRVMVLTAAVISAGAKTYGQTPEEQRMRALQRMPVGPVLAPDGKMPVPEALKVVGASLLDGNYVIFGLEMRLKDGKEPTVSVKFEHPGMLVDVLIQIMLQLPDYEIDFLSSHLATITPKGAEDDPDDVLNLRVTRFHVDGVRAGAIFADPGRFMSELNGRLATKGDQAHGPAQTDTQTNAEGPVLSMQLGNYTVRQIFNIVSEATERYAPTEKPTGWAYSFQSPGASSSGGGHSFTALVTVPSGWHKP